MSLTLSHQLCDNSIGVLFNDNSHIVLRADGENYEYINGTTNQMHTLENFPPEMKKKITILKYFITYMNENLLKAGESAKPKKCDAMTQVPYLRSWLRTKHAIVFHLTNGTFQVNFYKDHTKIVLCPIMEAVSLMDEDKNFTVYSMKLIMEHGCPSILASRLKYARDIVQKMYLNFQAESGGKK